MNIKGWPFLVSRNRTLGYQTIVAPDFMIEAKIAGLLSNEAGGNLTKHPRYRKLDTKIGAITIVYRIVTASKSNKTYLDEFGRPILWIEGIVLKGSVNETEISQKELREAHKGVEIAFQEFWKSTEKISVKSSKPFNIPFVELATTEKNGTDKPGIPTNTTEDTITIRKQPELIIKWAGTSFLKAVTILLIVSFGLNFLLAIYLSSLKKENLKLQSTVGILQEDNQKLQTIVAYIKKEDQLPDSGKEKLQSKKD